LARMLQRALEGGWEDPYAVRTHSDIIRAVTRTLLTCVLYSSDDVGGRAPAELEISLEAVLRALEDVVVDPDVETYKEVHAMLTDLPTHTCRLVVGSTRVVFSAGPHSHDMADAWRKVPDLASALLERITNDAYGFPAPRTVTHSLVVPPQIDKADDNRMFALFAPTYSHIDRKSIESKVYNPINSFRKAGGNEVVLALHTGDPINPSWVENHIAASKLHPGWSRRLDLALRLIPELGPDLRSAEPGIFLLTSTETLLNIGASVITSAFPHVDATGVAAYCLDNILPDEDDREESDEDLLDYVDAFPIVLHALSR